MNKWSSDEEEDPVEKWTDMFIADTAGIISSIIYGPERRTRITARTEQTLFTTYAPREIAKEAVMTHLQDIENFVRLVALQAERVLLEVYGQ